MATCIFTHIRICIYIYIYIYVYIYIYIYIYNIWQRPATHVSLSEKRSTRQPRWTLYNQVQPGTNRYNQIQPDPTKSNQVQPGPTRSNQVQPSTTKYNQVQPGTTKYKHRNIAKSEMEKYPHQRPDKQQKVFAEFVFWTRSVFLDIL